MVLGDWRLIGAIFAGIVIAIIVGALMSWIVCRPVPEPTPITKTSGNSNPVSTSPQTADDNASGAVATGAGAAAVGAAAAASASDNSGVVSDTETAEASKSSSGAGSDDKTGGSSSVMKPSAPLAGTQELSERQGTWKYEGTAEKSDAGSQSKAKSVLAAVSSADTLDSSEVDDSASIEAETGNSPADPAKTAAPTGDAATDIGEDYDKDGIFEGENEGSKPEALSGPRGGKADNLKEIKGIGPKLEILCNELGFYHFDQIANWTADEVAWVNANLAGFKGRVTRDTWVEQAKVLAAGGETEFSKRVEDGGVY